MESSGVYVIDNLIQQQLWDHVEQRLREYPEEASGQSSHPDSGGRHRLHWLCSMGSTPGRIIEIVASLDPQAIVLADQRFYGDTALHSACRNSVVSSDKITSLLLHCPDPQTNLLIRNQLGGTALHSAANHNAVLSVLEALIRANTRLLSVTTFQGLHSVTALWSSYNSTIPGVMCAARILQGETEASESLHFTRFWEKCKFLAIEHFKLVSNCCPDEDNIEYDRYVLHGLIRCNVPFELFQIALKLDTSYALAADINGSLPLHLMLENRPYRLKEKQALSALLEAAPESYSQPNLQGDVPLTIAIRNRIPWENGLKGLAGPNVLQRRDKETGLLPFQLAASIGGRVSIETMFHLLTKQPDLLQS